MSYLEKLIKEKLPKKKEVRTPKPEPEKDPVKEAVQQTKREMKAYLRTIEEIAGPKKAIEVYNFHRMEDLIEADKLLENLNFPNTPAKGRNRLDMAIKAYHLNIQSDGWLKTISENWLRFPLSLDDFEEMYDVLRDQDWGLLYRDDVYSQFTSITSIILNMYGVQKKTGEWDKGTFGGVDHYPKVLVGTTIRNYVETVFKVLGTDLGEDSRRRLHSGFDDWKTALRFGQDHVSDSGYVSLGLTSMKAITSKELNSDDIDKITMYSDSSQAKKFIQGDPTLGKKLLELSENDSVGQYFSLCPVDKYEWLMALEDRPSAKSMEFVKEWLGVKEIENIVDLAKRIDTENKEIFKTNKLIVYEDDKKETVDVGASIVNYEGLKQDYAAKKSEWKEKFKDMSYFDVDFYFMLKENLDVDRGFIKEARNYLLPQNVDGPKPEKIIELAKELMGKFDYETYDSLFKTENETRYHQIDLLDGLMEIGYDLEEIKELSGKITNLAYLNRVATTMEFDKFPKLEVDELSMLINSDTSLIHARQYFDAGLVGEDTDHQYPSFLVPVFVAHEMSPSDLQHFRETTDIQQNYWEKTIRDPKKFKFERFVDDFRKRYNKDTK